jgi:hypothetical protein
MQGDERSCPVAALALARVKPAFRIKWPEIAR